MLIDLHVHSRHTQGCALEVREVLRRAREEGLDGVVFTDLNGLEALPEVRAAAREEGILGLVGAELVTDHGHFLCYFPEPEKLPALPQLLGTPPFPVRAALAKVRELGGAAVAAHPYDKSVERPLGDVIFTLDGLAAVEGLNSARRGPANDLAIEAADHMNLPCVAGSGAFASLEEIGKAATLFRRPVSSEAELVAELQAGAVYCVALGVTPQPVEPSRRGPRRDERPRGDRRGGRGHGGRRERR